MIVIKGQFYFFYLNMKMNELNIQIILLKKILKLEINIRFTKKMYLVGEGIGAVEITFTKIFPVLS